MATKHSGNAYFFGALDGHGHLLYDRFLKLVVDPSKLPVALAPWKLDERFCPKDEQQRQGWATLQHIDQWTVLGFWDRTGDRRYGSNSAFLLHGQHGFEALVRWTRQFYPGIWARFTFEVRLVEHRCKEVCGIRE